LLAHDRAFKGDVGKMLADARQTAAKVGVNIHHKNRQFDGGDHNGIAGFDTLARTMSERYPHLLGAHGYSGATGYDENADEASERLFDYLAAGNPEPMAEDDAYEQALDQLHAMNGERGAAR